MVGSPLYPSLPIQLHMSSTHCSVGIDWIVKESVKNLLMHVDSLARLRKRIYSRQNLVSTNITEYFDGQWKTYLEAFAFLKMTPGGAQVLELGAGPIRANGIRFIAEGASSYTALDRFELSRRDWVVKDQYEQLIKRLPIHQRQRCQGLLAANAGTESLFDSRIETRVGKIEEAHGQLREEEWDIVVSFDVLEHVDDPYRAIETIRRLLKPGGLMVHRVDVSAHNMAPHKHRLAHLTLSDRTWRAISSKRAICNRFRPSEFRAIGDAIGFETLRFVPTSQLTQEQVAEIRPKLWKRFARCSFEDLAVLDFVWIARRPA